MSSKSDSNSSDNQSNSEKDNDSNNSQNSNNEEEESQNSNKEENNEDINDLFVKEENDELTVEELREKIRRSGVLYMSYVPIGMKIIDIRRLLEDYGIQRCFFIPLKKKMHNVDGKKVQAYKEGWIEFEDKIYAKLAEYQLNGRPIGGNKKCIYRDELWNLKYLHKFKWNDLVEDMTMQKKKQEKELKMEIAQSNRVNNFIVKNYEKSKKYLNKKREKEKNKEEENEENVKNKEGKSKYKQKKLIY